MEDTRPDPSVPCLPALGTDWRTNRTTGPAEAILSFVRWSARLRRSTGAGPVVWALGFAGLLIVTAAALAVSAGIVYVVVRWAAYQVTYHGP